MIEVATADVARSYAARIRRRCQQPSYFAARGSSRPELEAGIRSVPFERSATISYRIVGDTVEVVRIIRNGRDLRRLFSPA